MDTTSLFLVGTGITVALALIAQGKWRHPALLVTLGFVAAALLLAGLFLNTVRGWIPSMVNSLDRAASSPLTWAVVASVCIAAAAFAGWRAHAYRYGNPPVDVGGLALDIYVGEIRIFAERLDEGFAELTIRGFNGSPHSVGVGKIRGSIRLELKGKGKSDEATMLDTPILLADRTETENIPSKAEFMLVFNQYMPTQLAEKVATQVGIAGARFLFESLEIEIIAKGRTETATVKLWHGVRVFRDGMSHTSRISRVDVSVAVGAQSSFSGPNDK